MTVRSLSGPFTVGVMKMEVEGRDSQRFSAVVARAVDRLDATFAAEPRLRTRTLAFEGAHLTPGPGVYAPLDFLEIGLAEKLERDLPFLLIVTEVDLSSSSLAYTLALPSQLTNIAVLSTRRLDPAFWGDAPDPERIADRLAALMLHCFGHLNALRHVCEPTNVMYALEGVQDLDRMTRLDADQLACMSRTLPREARERSTRTGKARFVLQMLVEDAGAIVGAVARANPFRLLAMMPTMLAAALSVIVVLLFSAETWDVASAVTVPQIATFSLICLASAAFVLYRAFAFDTLLSRDRRITESGIVTMAATIPLPRAHAAPDVHAIRQSHVSRHSHRVPGALDGELTRRRRSDDGAGPPQAQPVSRVDGRARGLARRPLRQPRPGARRAVHHRGDVSGRAALQWAPPFCRMIP